MPLLGNKPKQKEKPKDNEDNVSPEQWIKNSGHSLKGIFLEWLSEQKLFSIINGEIKRIKKENQRKKNMTPEDKLAWKRKAAKLSDETIAKFGKEYLGQNSAEETKEYIRNGLNTVANQIKTGNFYKKASLFGDEDMDKFMEDLEAEWDEDEFSSSGESFMKPHREFMLANEPITKNDKHQQNYELEKNSYDGTYNYTVNVDTPFPGHFNVTVKNKDSERPSGVVKSILENMDKIEALWKKYISSPKFKKEFESEWEDIQYNIDTEGDEWLENVESEMDRSGFVKDPLKLKNDLWKYATNPENVWLYFDEGSDKITVVFGYYLEWVQQGFDWAVKLSDIGINSSKGESVRPYSEFMSANKVDNRPIFTSKKLPNLERVVSKHGPHFFQDSYGPGELQDDYDFNIYLHTDGPYDDVSDIQVELYNKLTKDRSFIKKLESIVSKEGVREQKKNGVFTLYYIYSATIYPDGTMEIEPYYGYREDDGEEYSDEGDPYIITTYKTKSKGENYSSRYKAFRRPHREFMSVNDMGKTFDKGVDKLYQMKYGMSQDEYFKKHFPDKRKYPDEPAEKKSKDPHANDFVLEEDPYYKHLRYFVHIDKDFPGSFQVVVKDKNSKNPSETVKQILSKMDVIEQKWREYIKSPKIKKEFEEEWKGIEETIKTEGKEWLEDIDDNVPVEGGAANDPNNLKKAIWENISDPDTVEIKYKDGSDKLDIHFGYFFEWISQGYDWDLKLSDIGITTTKGESYFMKYKAMGEFSKGGSDKNVFTIGLGDIKRYEGLLKIYTSTKKSIRGFVNKVIKIANKDVNEAKEYANKNSVDYLLDKMSDADNNLLDEMSDLVKGKLEPKNLPVNVAKKMKSYLDKQHKVFTSYDMPEDLYNKWKEIYSSNESDPTMKAINNTARFFEPNTVNGSDYGKIFDKFKDFKVSAPTPAAEMMYLTQRESVLSNDDVEELSNAIDRYNAMKREYGPKLLKVMNTVMNNKEDLDQGEITIDDFDLEEFSASDASYDLEKAIKNIDAINFDKSDYTTKERLRQEFKHLMDVCDFEVIPRSDSEKWKKFSEDNYSSRFSSQYPDIVEFIDRELSYIEKDFLASKEFKNIYKRVGEAKLNDIINKSPIGENFIKRLGGKR